MKPIPTEMRKRILDDLNSGMTWVAAAQKWKIRSRDSFVFFVLCCVLLFSQTASGETTSDEWAVRIKEEAPAAWTSYINAWNNTSVEFTERGVVGNDVVADTYGFLVFSYPNVSQRTTDNLTSLTTVVVSNINYEFSLTRTTEEPWDIWNVQNDHAVSAKNSLQFPLMSADNPLATSELFVGRNFARGLMVSVADWFPNVFNQPEFQILDMGHITEDSELLVSVRYGYNPQPRPNQLVRSGEIYLLPDHYWLMKRANLELVEPDGMKLRASIICEYDFSGAVPRLLRHTLSIREYNYTLQRSFSNYLVRDEIPFDIFTLSHYGFPEPDFGERRATPFRYLLATIGVLMIIFALWRMYRRHRESKT